MSSTGSAADFTTTLIFLAFKPNNDYSPELFQRVLENTRRKHQAVSQWHGLTVEKPREVYWFTATDIPLAAAPTSALVKSISPLSDGKPEAFAMTMHRPITPVLRSPVTISGIMDLADGQPNEVAEVMVNQTADMQHGMPGFCNWTYGLTEDKRRVVYMGGWESIEDSMDLANFGREEDAKLVEAAEETFSFFSSVLIKHTVFKEESPDSAALDSPL